MQPGTVKGAVYFGNPAEFQFLQAFSGHRHQLIFIFAAFHVFEQKK
jgi:hypothetical protein